MKTKIIRELEEGQGIIDWSVRTVATHQHQLYFVPDGIESQRVVESEHYEVDILKQVQDEQGQPGCGLGNAALLAGDDIGAALDEAQTRAEMVHNPPYRFPDPGQIPDVPLVDPALTSQPEEKMKALHRTLKDQVAQVSQERNSQVRMTSAEFFVDQVRTGQINSRGLDARQEETLLHIEYVLTAGQGLNKVESFVELTRRQLDVPDLQAHAGRHADYALDLLLARPPEEYHGPIVLQHQALSEFINAFCLRLMSSAELKLGGISPWEIGSPVFQTNGRQDGQADPITIWANRCLPYGVNSNCFDAEGLPAQRLPLVEAGKLVNFTANTQYAAYLSVPATGEFGNFELDSGSTPAETLLSDDHVEVAAFSYFSPDVMSGDFACEIRLGYIVEAGQRRPFKGGMLVGNWYTAMADIQLSQETDFYGDYQGPTTARVGELTVS
ncbi:metallopeptidase TldD-related protein [Chloroflexota bacterium]